MDASYTIPIDSTIILLQLLHILIRRAILATEENKRIISDTHHVEDQGIQLTLSPILLSPQALTAHAVEIAGTCKTPLGL